tara:strand:- start:148 stop:447 length:300 start_codon:yes stop_codon:yes gene_type:complete
MHPEGELSMTDKTLFGPDWYQDPNDNRIHDENGDDILDKHSLGELQKIVNSHDALVEALYTALNTETVARIGSESGAMQGFDYKYHYDKIRTALEESQG